MLYNTVPWKILSYFFEFPSSEMYVKDASRKLKISSGSASSNLKTLSAEGILKKKAIGREIFYSLDNDDFEVKKLKASYFINKLKSLKIKEKLLKTDSYLIAAAVFGSFASGEYTEKSDIDFLIISGVSKDKFYPAVKSIQNGSFELNLVVMKPAEWLKLARQKDAFYNSVLRNNITLHGNLVVE